MSAGRPPRVPGLNDDWADQQLDLLAVLQDAMDQVAAAPYRPDPPMCRRCEHVADTPGGPVFACKVTRDCPLGPDRLADVTLPNGQPDPLGPYPREVAGAMQRLVDTHEERLAADQLRATESSSGHEQVTAAAVQLAKDTGMPCGSCTLTMTLEAHAGRALWSCDPDRPGCPLHDVPEQSR